MANSLVPMRCAQCQQASEYAAKGYRTLAVAMGDDQKSLRILGLVALYHMPRPDAKKLIGELKGLGISVKMLTGDSLPIAKETARQVGLSDAITTSMEFENALKMSRIRPLKSLKKVTDLPKYILTINIRS